jgi:hypothetical protein
MTSGQIGTELQEEVTGRPAPNRLQEPPPAGMPKPDEPFAALTFII